MELRIAISHSDISERFVAYLIKCLRRAILRGSHKKILSVWSNYLKSLNINCGAEKVVLEGINALTYYQCPEGYVIRINPNAKVSGTPYCVESLCKMINYGVFAVKPFPLFTKAIDEIANNIKMYEFLFSVMPI